MEQRVAGVRSRAGVHPSSRLPRERTTLGSAGQRMFRCSAAASDCQATQPATLFSLASLGLRFRPAMWACGRYRVSSSLPIPTVDWFEMRGHCVFRLGRWQPDPGGGVEATRAIRQPVSVMVQGMTELLRHAVMYVKRRAAFLGVESWGSRRCGEPARRFGPSGITTDWWDVKRERSRSGEP